MRETLRKRLEDRTEEGFTLIELMVVVLIIAILLAIAIPTFLGARTKAQDRAAQSDLRNALTTEKTFYVDNQAYTAATASLFAIEPRLTFGTTADKTTIGTQIVSSATGTNDVVCMTKQSASGTYYSIWEGAGKGSFYGSNGTSDPLAGGLCVGTGAPGTFKSTGF